MLNHSTSIDPKNVSTYPEFILYQSTNSVIKDVDIALNEAARKVLIASELLFNTRYGHFLNDCNNILNNIVKLASDIRK